MSHIKLRNPHTSYHWILHDSWMRSSSKLYRIWMKRMGTLEKWLWNIFSVAEDRFLESLQLVESLPSEDNYTYFLAVLKNLGSFYMQFKKFDLTAPLYEKAYDVASKVRVGISQCSPQHTCTQPWHESWGGLFPITGLMVVFLSLCTIVLSRRPLSDIQCGGEFGSVVSKSGKSCTLILFRRGGGIRHILVLWYYSPSQEGESTSGGGNPLRSLTFVFSAKISIFCCALAGKLGRSRDVSEVRGFISEPLPRHVTVN